MRFSISKKIILFLITCVCVGLFGFVSKPLQAQVSVEPLHITDIANFDVYPSMISGIPGLCVISYMTANEQTTTTFRYAPVETLDDPEWYTPSFSFSTDPSFHIGMAANVSVGLTQGDEYAVQLIEVNDNGSYHIITPENLTDDIQTMCVPTSGGTFSPSCPYSSTPIVTTCSPGGLNETVQQAGGGTQGVSIQNITTTQDSASFSLNTQSLNANQAFFVVYTTDPTVITNGNFSNGQMVSLTSNQGILAVNLYSLQPNTTYYVSVIDITGSIIISTPTNQSYEMFSTNSGTSDSSSQPNPATINVNLQGEFGQAELAGENIEQGFTQCGYGETYDCDFNTLLATIDRIIKFSLYIIVLPLAAILFAWSGIKLIIAQSKAKASALTDAKKMFQRVLLGLIFAFGAWVIVKFVLVILGYTDASGLLTQILGITTTQ